MSKKDKIIRFFIEHYNHCFMVMCMFIHIIYMVVFYSAGIEVMAVINLFSSCFYLLIILLLRKNQVWQLALTYIEIALYVVGASAVIGMESDFFLYEVGMLSLTFQIFPQQKKLRLTLQGFGFISLILAMIFSETCRDLYMQLRDAMLDIEFYVQMTNVLITTIILFLLTYMNHLRLEYASKKLEYSSEHDELTKLYNRHFFSCLQEQEKLEPIKTSVILMDIDHFKIINDNYGHKVGDKALVYLADSLRSLLRKDDYIIRWGGEEFVILLVGTSLKNATQVCERIRADISSRPYADASPDTLTVTLGVTERGFGEDLEKVIARADKLMYEGKMSGRNKVVSG